MPGRPAPRTIPARTPTIIPATDLGSVEVAKEGNLYLLTDPRGDIRLDGRGLGLYELDTRILSTSMLRLNGAQLTLLRGPYRDSGADTIQLTNPELRRNPADKRTAAPSLARRELSVTRTRRLEDGVLREEVADRELLGGDRGARHRARPGRGHGRHLRGPRLSAGCPRHALPGRGPRRPDRVRLRRARWPTRRTTTVTLTARTHRGRRRPGRLARGERRRPLEVAAPARPAADHRVGRRERERAVRRDRRPPPARGQTGCRDAIRQRPRPRKTRRAEARSRAPVRGPACRFGPRAARPDADPLDRATWRCCATTGRCPASTTSRPGSRGSRRCSGGTASSPRSRRSPSSRRFAVATLDVLARLQATTDDPWHDAEPGKILHEMRTGEMARAGETPHDAYYGSVDSTPLWLILLGEAHAWTGDDAMLERLWPNALAALGWIDDSGDLDGDGFVEYRRRSKLGLLNQGWKDSGDAIRHTDGKPADGPIALAEVQGYVYAAKRAMARLARHRGEMELAARLDTAADVLRDRFDEAFWMPEAAFLRDGPRRREAPGREHRLERRPGPLVRDRPGRARRPGRRTDPRARHVLRLGRPDVRLRSARLQPGRLPHRARSGRTTTR